jgi:serine/threonine protein kinase/tetratricopeptide (TPR) repeat protein
MDAPQQIGPYLIHSVLGRGGMGVVYEAEHKDSGELAALKTLRRGRRTSVTALRREIAALGDLRHPAIVKVKDTGVHEGRPWYAMEFVSGTTLSDAIAIRQRVRNVRVPDTSDLPVVAPPADDDIDVFGLDSGLRDLLGVLGQVSRALAYLHGMGRVHLDLKPANILLDHGGRAVLVDFGVTVSVGGRMVGEAVATSGLWAGTARYTAPERLARQPFDARADLFSLGCLLFEVITGRPPWYANSIDEARKEQSDIPAPRPSAFTVVAPELDALVVSLLAPRPADRVGHALEVVRVLESLGIDTRGDAEITAPRPYLYDSGLSGRDAEITRLRCALASASSDKRGESFLITGIGGVGKTRLAAEAARATRAARGMVLTGECARTTSVWGQRPPPRPFHLFERVVRYVADTFAAQPGQRRPLAGLGQIIAQAFPFVADGYNLEPPEEPPGEEDLLFAFLGIIEALVADRPALFVFDDLQWADPMSLRLLEVLARRALDRPWVIIALARTDDTANDLGGLSADFHEIPLRRLPADAVDDLIRAALATPTLPPGLSEEVFHRSRGIPLVAGEFLQYALVRGDLARDMEGRWSYLLPSAAEGTEEMETIHPDDSAPRLGVHGVGRPAARLLSERLDKLGAAERLTLEAAATLSSRQFDTDTLHAVTGLPDGKFGAALASLVRLGFLHSEDPWEASSHTFTREHVQAAVLAQIPEGARVRLNRACAEALEATSTDHAQLAAHWEAAGALEQAARASARAAGGAFATHQWERAEYFTDRALRHLDPSDPQVLALQVSVAGATALRGLTPAALGLLAETIDRARTADAPGVLGRALLVRSRIHARRGDFNAASQGWVEAIRIFREQGDQLGEADALTSLGAERVAHGQCAAAASPLGQAEQLYIQLDNAHGLARVLHLRGTVANETGEPTQAKAHLVSALRIARDHSLRAQEAAALTSLADVDTAMGRDTLARTRYETALGLLRELGATERAGQVLWRLGGLHLAHGRLDMAEEVVLLAEDGNRGDPVLAAHLATLRGRIFTGRGALEDASGQLDEALLTFERHEMRAEAIDARIHLGALHAVSGRFDAAVSVFKHAGRAIAAHDLRRLHLDHLVAFAVGLASAGALDGAERRATRAIELSRISRRRREEAWAHYVVAQVLRLTGRDAAGALRSARRLAIAVGDPILVGACRAERLYTLPLDEAAEALCALSDTAVALGCTQHSLLGKAIRGVARARDLKYARLDHRTGHHRPTLRAKAMDDASRSIPI